MARKKKN